MTTNEHILFLHDCTRQALEIAKNYPINWRISANGNNYAYTPAGIVTIFPKHKGWLYVLNNKFYGPFQTSDIAKVSANALFRKTWCDAESFETVGLKEIKTAVKDYDSSKTIGSARGVAEVYKTSKESGRYTYSELVEIGETKLCMGDNAAMNFAQDCFDCLA